MLNSSFAQEPYDEQKVEAIRVRLENYAAIGNPIDYQIFINGEEIVPRTSDVTRFDSFYDLITDKTKTISIVQFQGDSRHKKTNHFYIVQQDHVAEKSLNGFDPREEVAKQLNEFKLDFLNKQLVKDNNLFREEIVRLEGEKKKLEDELTDARADLSKLVSEQALGTQIISAIREFMPGQKPRTLSGPLQSEKNSDQTEESVVLTKQEHENYKMFDEFMSRFSKVEVGQIMHLIEKLSEKKQLIGETLQFIYSKNNSEDETPNND